MQSWANMLQAGNNELKNPTLVKERLTGKLLTTANAADA